MRVMKSVFPAALLLASLSLAGCQNMGHGQLPRIGDRSARLISGGSLQLVLPVGSVHIEMAQGNWLRLHYRIKPHHFTFWERAPRESRARLHFEVEHGSAVVRFSYPPHAANTGSIELTLDVPQRTNLHVKLGVGAIRVAGEIAGDKYLDTGVGQIRLGLGPKPDYRSVRLSTGVGSIEGGPWGSGQGFVAKALAAHPGGQYRLQAHTGVGSIQMHG